MANPREGVPYSIHVSMGCKRKGLSPPCRPGKRLEGAWTWRQLRRADSSPHSGAIQQSILDRLTDVMGTQVSDPLQISDGPGDFEHPIVGPG